MGLQCFKKKFYIYRRSKITREFSCVQYQKNEHGVYEGTVFNHGARYNVFYAERSGNLHYLKIPYLEKKAYITRNTGLKEVVLGEIDTDGEEKLFCIDGNVYVGYHYVGN